MTIVNDAEAAFANLVLYFVLVVNGVGYDLRMLGMVEQCVMAAHSREVAKTK